MVPAYASSGVSAVRDLSDMVARPLVPADKDVLRMRAMKGSSIQVEQACGEIGK